MRAQRSRQQRDCARNSGSYEWPGMSVSKSRLILPGFASVA